MVNSPLRAQRPQSRRSAQRRGNRLKVIGSAHICEMRGSDFGALVRRSEEVYGLVVVSSGSWLFTRCEAALHLTRAQHLHAVGFCVQRYKKIFQTSDPFQTFFKKLFACVSRFSVSVL